MVVMVVAEVAAVVAAVVVMVVPVAVWASVGGGGLEGGWGRWRSVMFSVGRRAREGGA